MRTVGPATRACQRHLPRKQTHGGVAGAWRGAATGGDGRRSVARGGEVWRGAAGGGGHVARAGVVLDDPVESALDVAARIQAHVLDRRVARHCAQQVARVKGP